MVGNTGFIKNMIKTDIIYFLKECKKQPVKLDKRYTKQ